MTTKTAPLRERLDLTLAPHGRISYRYCARHEWTHSSVAVFCGPCGAVESFLRIFNPECWPDGSFYRHVQGLRANEKPPL